LRSRSSRYEMYPKVTHVSAKLPFLQRKLAYRVIKALVRDEGDDTNSKFLQTERTIAEVSKNLARSENNFVWTKNNYMEHIN